MADVDASLTLEDAQRQLDEQRAELTRLRKV
jgi:hypothetical protein